MRVQNIWIFNPLSVLLSSCTMKSPRVSCQSAILEAGWDAKTRGEGALSEKLGGGLRSALQK